MIDESGSESFYEEGPITNVPSDATYIDGAGYSDITTNNNTDNENDNQEMFTPQIEQNGRLEGIGTLQDMVKESNANEDPSLLAAADLNAEIQDPTNNNNHTNHQHNNNNHYNKNEKYNLMTDPEMAPLLQNQNSTNNNNNINNNPNNNNLNTKTFITGVPHTESNKDFGTLQAPYNTQVSNNDPQPALSTEELMTLVEKEMLEHERNARYIEAEKSRQHLENLRKRFRENRRSQLESIQAEDVRVFFSMVSQHQDNFDSNWYTKTVEHKQRSDDLIAACKLKHEKEQRELYEALRRKRLAKFSVELLNMRKRQVMLAKAKSYIAAEKLKRKADMLEAIEIEKIREQAKEENQVRFQALLKKQEWERQQLAVKLTLEKRCLLEAKAQDFIRLKKRLRNAEQELKKTHIRQHLMAEKKMTALYTAVVTGNNNNGSNTQVITSDKRNSGVIRSAGRVVVSSGASKRMERENFSNSKNGNSSSFNKNASGNLSAREIALNGTRFWEEKNGAAQTQPTAED